MVDLQVITNTGANTVLTEALVEEFQTSLRGPLLQPGDAGYDDARIVWNGMIDWRPALIVRCAGVADVIQAVNFARDNHLLVSVRGGGHNITGYAVNDWGHSHRPVPDEERTSRSSQKHGASRGWPNLGRIQPRDSSLWPGQHRRRCFYHGHLRTFPWRWLGVAYGQARLDL